MPTDALSPLRLFALTTHFLATYSLVRSRKSTNFAFVIELDRHIEILLLDYECVIVPGLGGFMTHHIEARYDEGDQLFLPPLRTLGFNPQLKLNDSLLAQSYVEAYDISYPEAVQRIEAEVNELKQHIQNEGSYELNDIGVLFLNEDGNYQFEPCEAGVLTPELYGLGSFEMQPFSEGTRAKSQDSSSASGKASPAEMGTANATDKAQQEYGKKTTNEEEQNVIKIKVAWLRNAVAVAAAIIAFFAITPPISNSNRQGLPTGSLQGSIVPSIVQPSLSVSAEPKEEEVVESTTAEEEASPTVTESENEATTEVEVKPSVDDKPFCIVLASRVTRRNAEAFVDKLHSEGYEEATVYVANDIVRVVYGCYASEADAYSALRNVRSNKQFEQAWVYKKR